MTKATEPLHNKDSNNDDPFGFPAEFPYEFSISSPVETESSHKEEDFFAQLTRRMSQSSLHVSPKHHPLTSPCITSNKPQSTLNEIRSWSDRSAVSGDGSPNGSSRIPLPTTTLFVENNEPWEAFCVALGKVARLKCFNGEAPSFSFQNRGQFSFPRANSFSPNQDSVLIEEHFVKKQCGSVFEMQQSNPNWLVPQQYLRRYSSLPQSAWPLFQVQNQNQQIQCTGSGSRPGCGGTGVFLPRHHVKIPVETRKKSGSTPVLVPAKVVHALNVTVQSQFSNAFAIDYDTLLSRRDALLMQQQRLSLGVGEVAGYESCLPQEWTY